MTDNSAIAQTERLTMQRSFAEIAFDCRPKMTAMRAFAGTGYRQRPNS